MFIGSLIEELRELALLNTSVGAELLPFTVDGAENALSDYVAVALTTHVNNALRNLYSRFPLKEKKLYLGCKSGINVYLLNLDQVEAGTADQYILDETYASEVGPFVEDVFQITDIFVASTGLVVPLNEEGNPLSVLTTDSVRIRVPNSISTTNTVLEIHYKAMPSVGIVVEGVLDTGTTVTGGIEPLGRLESSLPWKGVQAATNMWTAADSWLPIPEQYIKAIAAYICYKVLYQADTTLENTDALFYQNLYENECRKLKQEGLFDKIDYVEEKNNKIYSDDWA